MFLMRIFHLATESDSTAVQIPAVILIYVVAGCFSVFAILLTSHAFGGPPRCVPLLESGCDAALPDSEIKARIDGLATGGDSYAVLSLAKTADPTEAVRIPTIVHHGEFPLYELEVRIVDLIELRELENPTLEDLNRLKFEIGNMSPKKFVQIEEAELNISREGQEYNVFFQARNGSWEQNIQVFRDNAEKYSYNTEIRRGDKVIYSEERSPDGTVKILCQSKADNFSCQ